MPSEVHELDIPAFRRQLAEELTGNILPFWPAHVVDRVNGGFHGAVANDLRVRDEEPRSAVLCARILWIFSAAYRRTGLEQHLSMARWAYDYLTRVFWDKDFGGLYWQVDRWGNPVFDRKHHYAQAFGLYGLAEYYRAAGDPESLALAKDLFDLLEEHGRDRINQGYIEARSRRWQSTDETRLSSADPYCHKSMNTMLHIMEAYTNLLRVWDDARLRAQHRALIEIFLHRIVDRRTGHLKLFFDEQWRPLTDNVSYGHDIESSWLLQGDPVLLAQVNECATIIADAVYRDGLDSDGSLFNEGGPRGLTDDNKAWWAQAEAMVGFYNAYQLTGRTEYARAALGCWHFIRTRLVDRTHGEWFKLLWRDGTPVQEVPKAGPWECPYHHSRACMEMLDRLPD